MVSRLLAAAFALCLAASAETMSVAKLRQFLESSAPMVQKGTMSDRELAAFLDKVKLTERLDERTIEDMQGDMRIGPKTLQALRRLATESASLPPPRRSRRRSNRNPSRRLHPKSRRPSSTTCASTP